MAKRKPRISPRDVPPDMVRVRTRWGDHLRKKRGTHKPAKLNAALQQATILIREANAAARLFKDAIDPYRKGLIDTTLWHRLVAIFRRQQTVLGEVDFSKLEDFEFHTRYTLHKIVSELVSANYDGETRQLRITVTCSPGPPRFHTPEIDGYKFTVVTLFPDLKNNEANVSAQRSDVRTLKDSSPFDVSFPVAEEAKCFVICLRIDGYSGTKKHHTIASRGMKIVGGGMRGTRV